MDLFEAIEKRHSYRGAFTEAPVPVQDIEKIIDAGIRAPSGHDYQTTSFVGVTPDGPLEEIKAIIGGVAVETCRAMLLVLSEKHPMDNGIDFELVDYGAATQNMLLAITALGYATVWIDGKLYNEDRAARIAALLGLPEGQTVRVALPIGVPVEAGAQKPKKSFAQRAKIL